VRKIRELSIASALAAALLSAGFPATTFARARAAQQPTHLALASSGATHAMRAFRDGAHGIWNGRRNVPLRWYDEQLHAHVAYPLATIWGAVPLFEALAAIASADPSAANRARLRAFALGPRPPSRPPSAQAAASARRRGRTTPVYGGAESYWDAAVGGFAPYPGDRGPANTWFDDNSWWGIAFMDAYRVLAERRLLTDAQAAFAFVARHGWDAAHGGGMWWNTAHTPGGQKSGEALAAGSLLGALLATALQEAAATESGARARADAATAGFDMRAAEKFLSWGDAHFATRGGLYSRTQEDATPMPYVAGPEIEAKELLCMLPSSGSSYCAQAAALADAAYARFAYRLNMGPQFDVIYLHWMLAYAQQTGDARWLPMALKFASDAQANARDATSGLYLKAWDGSDMSAHQAEPNMLRTDAATVELFAWLAANGA
jgi:hypothetical protein